MHRYTLSDIYKKKLENGGSQTLFGWGRDIDHPGHSLDAFRMESALGIFSQAYHF